MTNRLHICLTVLLVGLSVVAESAFGQQRTTNPVVGWGITGFQADSHPQQAPTTLFERNWATAQPVGASPFGTFPSWNTDPSFLAFSFKVRMERSSVELLKPIGFISPGLPQTIGGAPAQFNTGGWYQGPQTFDGLVQFVGAIRLNLQSAAYAQEGWTWGFAVGGSQYGRPNVGLSFRYKYKF